MAPTSFANHHHVNVTHSPFNEYALPTKIRIQKKYLRDLEDNLRNYTVPKLYQLITSNTASESFENCLTHLDSQIQGESGFFNLQVQLNNTSSIKTTVAKILVSHQLAGVNCLDCQNKIVECFFKAMSDSFSKSLPIHQTGDRIRNPKGQSFEIKLENLN